MANEATDAIDFRRGQVWFKKVDPEHEKLLEENPHLIKKDRFYLIISDDTLNARFPTVICAPTTSQENVRWSTDVAYKDNFGYKRVINTTQILTFDKSNLKSNWEYKYTLSKDIMEQVSKKLSIGLGVSTVPVQLDTLYKLVDEIVAKKEEELKAKYSVVDQNMVENMTKRIESMFKSKEVVSVDPVKEIKEPVKAVEMKPEKIIQIPAAHKKETLEKEDKKWTIEKQHQFMDDCNSGKYTTNELAAKYGFGSVKSFYSTKYKISKKLENEEA